MRSLPTRATRRAARSPFAGFSIEASPGVSAAAVNGLSINHSFARHFLDDALRTRVDVVARSRNGGAAARVRALRRRARLRQGTVTLPSTRFNSMTRKLGLQARTRGDVAACCNGAAL